MRPTRFIPTLAACAAAVLLTAPPAHADGFLSPNVGVNFGGDAGQQLADALNDSSQITYGLAAGWMGGGIVGVEEDFGYSPNFFGKGGDISSTRVVTLMTNVIIGVPVGGQRGGGVRPYVTGGIGVISQRIEGVTDLLNFDESDIGYDLGGGVMGFFSDHAGIRADVRYFRNFRSTGDAFDIEAGTFNFGRATVGFLLRF
jgi:hypothetical protein